MPSKSRTQKTSTKNIRFSHTMLEQIENVMKAQNTRNFSAWVKEACRDKIRSCHVSPEK
ncbi:DUF3950 domain-containing protein [Salmonella enterica]|nr:DUF3950 domain-containing protein [Salmonella enterica]EJX3099143.1 DUF3950 domain-containing protein [Salmonella enterica]EJX3109219.1 DUF3950 domain-containing protein [Salmonella enterica]EJX3600757.1 DUF3950 domain-containing protein [Salmonella enterica]EKQ0890242.1 DUF3950 domain-containing protein [Salmonella enterica]